MINDRLRFCPNCGKQMIYSTKYKKQRADKAKSLCKSCAKTGERNHSFGKPNKLKGKKRSKDTILKIKESLKDRDFSGNKNPMYGSLGGMYNKKLSEEAKIKISLRHKGKIVSKETRIKISQSRIEYYKKHPNSRKNIKVSSESKRKMRLSAIARINKKLAGGVQIFPSYNTQSIYHIEQYAKENGLCFQHAENGGEFYIKELGYWVDGYDSANNTVIEYYENRHKYTKEKDEQRMIEIIEFLKCKFIILHEDGNVEIY